jgi:hypothetical protein
MDLVFAPSQIETWSIDRLRPYARNAKIHGTDQVAKIAASMAKFGWTVPCMVADDGELIAGHGRVLAAAMLGLKDVPGTYRFTCSLLITSMSTTSGSANFNLKGAGTAIFGKMSMQDFGSRGTVAVGGTTAISGTASDVPSSGGALTTPSASAALRASIHGTFEITTAGTIIPSIALDTAAAANVLAGSYFECTYIGPAAALGGSWS